MPSPIQVPRRLSIIVEKADAKLPDLVSCVLRRSKGQGAQAQQCTDRHLWPPGSPLQSSGRLSLNVQRLSKPAHLCWPFLAMVRCCPYIRHHCQDRRTNIPISLGCQIFQNRLIGSFNSYKTSRTKPSLRPGLTLHVIPIRWSLRCSKGGDRSFQVVVNCLLDTLSINHLKSVAIDTTSDPQYWQKSPSRQPNRILKPFSGDLTLVFTSLSRRTTTPKHKPSQHNHLNTTRPKIFTQPIPQQHLVLQTNR